jgi:hypothetical protein
LLGGATGVAGQVELKRGQTVVVVVVVVVVFVVVVVVVVDDDVVDDDVVVVDIGVVDVMCGKADECGG